MMPLTRFTPRSEPMPKRMNISAIKPKSVVAALAAMEEKLSFMARRMASSLVSTS